MNPLARLMRAWGHEVQGSDRSIDQGLNQDMVERLRGLGIQVLPHDGSAIHAGLERFVFSTAVEAETPEFRAARNLGLTLVPRPALLAEVVNAGHPGIAVAGTSGKSTITGMIAWILRRCTMPATVVGGAALVGDEAGGCFVAGPVAGPVVAEACESDGTLIGYRPAIGVVHNISRDHAEMDVLRRQFTTFAGNCRTLLVNSACGESSALAGAKVISYGFGDRADLPLEMVSAGPASALGVVDAGGRELTLRIAHPGRHNLENACAALAVALQLGIDGERAAAALADFPGVARRFQVVGTTDTGIRVVDDYAHNGEKIRAAITAAQSGCERLVCVFQPHGFGPARFLRDELRDLLPVVLRPQDRWCYAGIYYAGGSVAKDISSQMLAADLPLAMASGCATTHPDVLRWVADEARGGDTVLVMGARDPALPHLARAIHDLL